MSMEKGAEVPDQPARQTTYCRMPFDMI